MSELPVLKAAAAKDRKLPIFAEFDDLAERIRVRAYNLFRGRGFEPGRELDDWLTAEHEICWPAAELTEEDDEFEVKVALAGFEPQDISVTATPRELMIKASHADKRKKTEDTDDAKLRWSEFRSNDVYRRIELPADINVEAVKADFKHGMLEIEAPKVAAIKPSRKKVKVRKIK